MVSPTVNFGTGAWDVRGLSTDKKPLDVPNGSSFYEMDTGNVYMLDAEHSQWIKQ